MSDQDEILDQKPKSESLTDQKISELDSVISLCRKSVKISKRSFELKVTWQEGFLLKFMGPYSNIDPEFSNFWSNSNILEPINPVWRVNLSSKAFNFINSDPKSEDFMNYLIELVKGRFKISEKQDYFCLILPLNSEINMLSSVIVKEKLPESGLRILVGLIENDDLSKLVKEMVKEILGGIKMLKKLNSLEYEKNSKEYTPGSFYFKIKQRESHNIEPSKPFKPLPEFELALPENLSKIKNHIDQNAKKYRKFLEINEKDWTKVFIKYLKKQQTGQVPFDIFSDFKILWKISIEKNLLSIFRRIKEQEFFHYFNKILQFAQGFVITDPEKLNSLYERDYEDFILVPLVLDKTNLKSIFTALCVGKSIITNEFEYQIKVINFYESNSTLEEQANEFRKSESYIKIQEIFQRPGIKSLFFIDKNLIITPVPFNFIKAPSSNKSVFFFSLLSKDPNDYIIDLLAEPNLKFPCDKHKIEYEENNMILYIIESKNNLENGQRYTLKLKEEDLLGSSDYTDNTERKIANFEFNFIFETNFIQESRLSGQIKDFSADVYMKFCLFFEFSLKIDKNEILESLFQSFSNMNYRKADLQKLPLKNQSKIVELINSYYTNNNSSDEVIRLYRVLSVLGLVEMFPSNDKCMELNNLSKIIKNIKRNSNILLKIFKANEYCNLAITGLSKILALALIRKIKTIEIFKQITDYKTLTEVIIIYLQIIKQNKFPLHKEELTNIIEYIKPFNRQQKKLALNQILELITELRQVTEFLLNPALNFMPIEEKKKYYTNVLKVHTLTNKELLNYLLYLSENKIYDKKLFSKDDIINLIKRHMLDKNNTVYSEFPVIKKVLNFIQNDKHLSGFNLKEFIQAQVMILGFNKCISLLSVVPNHVPEIFDNWNKKNFSNSYKIENIENLDSDLNILPENIQETISLSIFNKISDHDLKLMIEQISKLKSKSMKNAYVQVFEKKLMKDSEVFKNTVKFLIEANLNNNENLILNEITNKAFIKFKIKKKELDQRIIIKPEKSDFLLGFIKIYDRGLKIQTFEKIFEFIQNLISDIVDKTIIIRDFEIIYRHKQQEKETFLEYINLCLVDQKDLEKFFKTLKKNKNYYGKKIKTIRRIEKVVSEFSYKFTNLFDTINEVKEFSAKINSLSLKNFNIPNSILNLEFLSNFPFRSIIFVNSVHRSEKKFNKNFQECLTSTHESIRNFLCFMNNGLKTDYSVNQIEKIVECLDSPNLFKKEIKALSLGYPDIFELGPLVTKNLLKSFELISAYKLLNPLLISLDVASKILNFPKGDFIINTNLGNKKYSNKILSNFLKLMQTDLANFNTREIESLVLLFNQIKNSDQLLKLLFSLEEEDLNFWHESFDPSLESKELSLKLIQNFSVIWSFFDILKANTKSLKSYFLKIVELMSTDKYSSVTEFIFECNQKLSALDEYNKSLNNQEQIKLNNIKMICQDSYLRIFYIEKYSAEVTFKSNKGLSSDPIGLNDLTELRERALLSKFIILQQIDKSHIDRTNDLQFYDQYVILIETMCKYISVLNDLNNSLFADSIPKELKYYIKDGDFEILDNEYKKNMIVLNESWKKNLYCFYKKSYVFNFFSENILLSIDRFIFYRSDINLNRILKVFEYIGKKIPNPSNKLIEPPIEINERLFKIYSYLTKLSNIPKPIQPSSSKIIEKIKGSILLCETKEFYRGVLSIYSNFQKTLPRSDLLLFCHFSTKWLEIKRFINRSILNAIHEIYTLIYPEKLTLENQIKIDLKLNRIIMKKQLYSLAIVTNDTLSKLVNNLLYNNLIEIEKVKNSMMLNDNQISSQVQNIAGNFIVVTSAYSGLGKSELIKEAALKNNLPLVEINISATCNNASLSKKIENYFGQIPSVFKLNLDFLSDPENFHELIFALSLFKVIYNEHCIISIPENSFIYIEVANTFKNSLYNSLSFLKYLKTEHINEFNLKNLTLTKKVIYVCNYLGLLDNGQINNNDLTFEKDSIQSRFPDSKIYPQLLGKYFLPSCGNTPNYHQLNSFLKVLSRLFQNFEQSLFSLSTIKTYKSDYINYNMDIFSTLRSCIILNLIETSKEFMSRCVESVKQSQNMNLQSSSIMAEEKVKLIGDDIKWENSNHFIMIFLQDGDFMNIYRLPDMIPISIKRLIISQNLIEKIIMNKVFNIQEEWKKCEQGIGYIEDFNNYKSSELVEKLLNFYKSFSLKRVPGSEEDKEDIGSVIKRRLFEAINTGYILTPDNFLKINLIFIRCMSNLPLIIMGETGCGKTSLLRFFIENILRESFLIIYIHSGITLTDIQNHLNKANEMAEKMLNQRVWVFFDEFNTSDCMGEIVSVLCERRFENMDLHKNIVFVGACNPYRIKSTIKYSENVGIKKIVENQSKVQLVHMVKPLPDKAIEFVWDFGTLKHNEIRDYVNSMLDKVGIKQPRLFTYLICAAHEYFQKNEDYSSVSLRDINRFIILCKWFNESINRRKVFKIESPLSEYYEVLNKIERLKGIDIILPEFLSFMHCYFLRLSTFTQRKSFLGIVLSYLDRANYMISEDNIIDLIRLQELDLLSRMVLPKEIAANQALMENIFAIVPCILNKIPIFICGKPGCSKSLAINIIFSSLRGDRSFDDYFKTLPELQIVSFQGSDSCTSEGIEAVFEKAEKLITRNRGILPVVLFDEIGLAEISKHNPLKILHKLLEYENCKVGFIAISNWRLDSSKMNRALYLARPDPGESDLILTAETIFRSHIDITNIQNYMNAITELAKGYYRMKQDYAKTEFPDFFGLRDFYHTVKYVARNIKLNLNKSLNEIIQLALYRNFDGLPDSIDNLIKYYPTLFQGNKLDKNPVKLINRALEDSESRYLMIICAQDTSEYLRSEILSKSLKDFRYILGSTFEKDIDEEDLRFRVLSDIIGYMEQGIPIVLQNMNIIYCSLYDLFNQNFTILGKTRKYCRVALGAQLNRRCLVHDKFRAIIFLDSDEKILQSTDAPFLNRFEKHYIVLNDVISTDSVNLCQKICKWVEMIVNIPNKKTRLNVTSVFPVFSLETINLLVSYLGEDMGNNEKGKKCKRFLLQNASTDVVLLCKMNEMSVKHKNFIVNEWKKMHDKSIVMYFNKLVDRNRYLAKGKRVKMISATYDSAGIDFIKQNLGQIIQLEQCSKFKSEEVFKKNYEIFLNDPNKILYVIEFDYSKESHHLRLIINLIDSIDKTLKINENKLVKNICVIVRQKRSDENRKALFFFENWRYKIFENLISSSNEIILELIDKKLSLIVKEEKIFKFENFSYEIAEKSLDTLLLKTNLFDYSYLNAFKRELLEAIIGENELLTLFKKKIIETFDQLEINSKDKWVDELFTNEKVITSSVSIKDAMKVFIYNKFQLEFTKLIFICERKSGLSSLLFTKKSKFLLNLWKEYFSGLKTGNIQIQLLPESNEVLFLCKFSFPFFYEDYKGLKAEYFDLMESGKSEGEIIFGLEEFYFKKTILMKNSNLLFENEELKKFFVEDFIKTCLSEKQCETKFTEYIYFFIEDLVNSSNSDAFLKILFDSQNKIISLNNIISIYSRNTLMKNLDPLTNVLSNKKISLPNKLVEILKITIDTVIPSKIIKSNLFNLQSFSEDIHLLKDCFKDLITDIKPASFGRLEFLDQLCRLNKTELFLNICNKILWQSEKQMFEMKNLTWVTKTISEAFRQDNVLTYSFNTFYFNNALKNNIDALSFILNQINNTEIWKYSGKLIETLLTTSSLKDIIKNFELNLINFNTMFDTQNPFLRKLLISIEALTLDSPFSVLLKDKIKVLKFEINSNRYGAVCRIYMDYIESSSINKDKLKLLIAVSRVQHYLDDFASLLHASKLQSDQMNAFKSMEAVLKQRKILTYEIYLLKVLKMLKGCSVFELDKYCEKTIYKWNIEYKEIKIKNNLQIFPIVEDAIESPTYSNIILRISLLRTEMEILDDIINNPKIEDIKFQLGLGFINFIYLMHKKPNFDSRAIVEWYNKRSKIIENNFGKPFALLLKLLITNFPKNTICHQSLEITNKSSNIAMLICYTVLISVSYSTNKNIFSNQFFTLTGEYLQNFYNHSSNNYYIGAESRKIQDYLNMMNENYDYIKNNGGSGTYICSYDCDYLYIIQNCGGAVVISKCPFCDKDIGGSNHQIVQRPGHRPLSDQEAKNYLMAKKVEYQASQPKGFKKFNTNIPQSLQRKLKYQNSFNLLNFFTNSVFYFLKINECYPSNQISQIYGVTDVKLADTIKSILNEDYNELESKFKGVDFIYWLLATANKLREVCIEYRGENMRKEDRDRFEEFFEQKVMAQSFFELANQYKKCLNTQTEPSILANYIEEMDSPAVEKFKYAGLFRFTLKPDWNMMTQRFELIEKKNNFSILNHFIHNYEELKNLEFLWPIICFSREMINECSFKISRAEAKKIRIKDLLDNNSNLKKSFQDFLNAWNNLKIEIRFGCKTFKKFEISFNTPVGDLLVDTDINSRGITLAAVLKSLCELQNSICILLQKNNIHPAKKHYLSTLSKDDIFFIKPDKLESIVQKYSINSFEYGKGREVFFDFQQILANFERILVKAKLLESDKLEMVQYQYELLYAKNRYVNVFSEIRERIQQLDLEDSDIQLIERNMKINSDNWKLELSEVWNLAYTWLGKAILFIRHSKLRSEDKIVNYGEIKCNFSQNYKVPELFVQFKIGQFIQIYELVEMKVFPKVVRLVEKEYKIELPDYNKNKEEINRFLKTISEKYRIDTAFECHRVLRRIIIRLLSGNMDFDFEIADYFWLECYWNFKFLNFIDEPGVIFPSNFKLAHAIEVEKLFEAWIRKI